MTKSNFLPLSLTCSKETIECTLEPVHCKALTEKNCQYHSFGKIIDLRFRRKWVFILFSPSLTIHFVCFAIELSLFGLINFL